MSQLYKFLSFFKGLRSSETSFSAGAGALFAAAVTSTIVDVVAGHFVGNPLPLSAYFAVLGGHVCLLLLLVSGFVLIDRVLGAGLKCLHRSGAKPYLIGVFIALSVAPLFYRLAGSIVSGEWISQQKFAWAIFLIPAFFGPLFVGVAAAVYLRFLVRIPLGGKWIRVVALFLILCTVSFYAGLCILPFRFNPLLSIALSGLSSAFAFAFYLRLFRAFRISLPRAVRITANVLIIVFVLTSSAFALFMSRSTRSEIVNKSITLGELFRKGGPVGSQSLLFEALEYLDMSEGMDGETEDLPRGLISSAKDWNIVLLVVDGLRADALWPNRSENLEHARSSDTPFLNKWMTDAYVFRRAYAQGSRTHRSMPALFRSTEPFEDPDHIGVSLGTYMHSLGRDTFAAIPTLFTQAFRKTFQNLLIDFDEIHHQEIQEQDKQVGEFLKTVESRKSKKPLFGWIHFYYLHSPGYAGRILTNKDGTKKQIYRKSLQYLDKQMKKLIGGLKKAKLDKKTIYIFTADHGENLGDNRDLTHGFTVFEEATRVPLFIKIPGLPGGVIDQTVGNIDIVPTIADLLLRPVSKTHRGHSLVPLMMDPKIAWEHDYFTKNAVGEMISMVRGQDKIIQDIEADTIYRYDLRTDPKEDKNLFNMNGELDRSLLLGILRASPERFADQLKTSEIQELLLSRIREVDENTSDDVLSFLFKLSNADPSGRAQKTVIDLFKQSADQRIRLAILRNCYSRNPRGYTALLVPAVQALKKNKDEQTFIDRLFRQNQPEFSDSFVARTMKQHATKKQYGNLKAWLQLTGNWEKKPIATYASAFTVILKNLPSNRDKREEILRLVLEDISASTRKRAPSAYRDLARLVEQSVTDVNPAIREAALKALGAVGDNDSVIVMSRMMESAEQPLKVQQAYLRAVSLIKKEKAIPILSLFISNQDLQVDIIRILQDINSPDGIPLLKIIADTYPAGFFRTMAKKTIDTLKKKKKS